MKKITLILLTISFCGLTACKTGTKKGGDMDKETLVKIETTAGDIKVKLYNETPKHRDNFIKLVKDGVYEGTLFHRVIKDFMIQAGDPDSKNAPKGKMLGAGDVGYTVPAEFVYPKYFHKKGALSAARQGDNVNPKKESSGCQFYIVTGKVYNDSTLLGMESQMNENKINVIFNNLAQKHMKEIYKMRKANDENGLYDLQEKLFAEAQELSAKEPEFHFTPEQIEAYTTVGGTPHLDGEYTVFGEVVEGMDVVDKIQKVKTDRSDRPEEDVKIIKATILDYILDNGLRLVHSRDESTQMVALNILYNVGARDEHPEHTGFAHLFEHLMFGGSVNIPDYDMPLQLAGGENNAWTNNDITNYYLTVPRQNVETGFWLESDRMLSLDFSERSLEVQRGVVMEEFKQRCLNQPYGDVGHLLRPLAYQKHPYLWPTIGKDLSHVANATLEEVKAFFFRFYAPNNAILAVTGNISFEEAVELTEKWFGSVPRREVPVRNLPQEPEQTEERRLTVERNVPLDSLFMAYHMCDHRHPDYYVFDILSDVLSNGRSSRLNQHLVQEKQLFSSIDAYISGSVDAGLFHIAGKPSAGVSLERAEAAVRDELDRLQQELVDGQELEKVKNKFESTQIFGNINYLNVATNLAWFELLGKAEDLEKEVERYRSVTAMQLREVAQSAFRKENGVVLYYKSK